MADQTSHDSHPSLMELKRKKSAQVAKEEFLEKVISVETEAILKEEINPSSIEAERLKKFSHSGDKYFKILVSSIQTYKDKSLQIRNTNDDANIRFNPNDIVQGTYVDNKRVLFGAPYNLYCSAKDVEPVDIDHSTYLHQQKEQQMHNQRNKSKNYRNTPSAHNQPPPVGGHAVDAEDDYKMAQNESDIDVEMTEKAKLMDPNKANKPRDPSLSDYLSVSGDKKAKKGYAQVGNASDAEAQESLLSGDDQGPIIIMKRDVWYKRYPYNICIVCCVFLCLLILDVVLMAYVADLKAITEDMDTSICDHEDVELIYEVKYLLMSALCLVGLSMFCNLMYFGPYIVKRAMGKLLVNSLCSMMMILYLCASGWQMVGMSKAINTGIDGLSSDTECNVDENAQYIEDLNEAYSAITILTLMKIFQGIALCVGGCGVAFVRSRSKRQLQGIKL